VNTQLDPTFVLSNHIEAAFWCAIGLALLVSAARHLGAVRRDCLVGAVTFVVFGISDWVEATTGAWWRPWWLFVWKSGCLLILLILLVRYARRRRVPKRI
jgi:hypothetical protein